MSYLQQDFLGNSLTAWLVAVAVAIFLTLALRLLRGPAAKRLAAIAGNFSGGLGDVVFGLVSGTNLAFLLVFGLYVGTYFLTLSGDLRTLADTIMILALLVQAGIWGGHLIREWVTAEIRRRKAANAASATAFTVIGGPLRFVLWSILVLVALDNIGVDVTALIAGLGIGGVAIALASQKILGDLFGSLSIVLDQPFVIGDFIIVDDKMGTVERIGLKTTRVRALSGELIVFPNTDLLESRVRNYQQLYERRIVFGIGVVYQTPADTIEAIPGIVREIIEAQPNARFDRGHFKAFGAYSLDFEFVYYVTVPEYAAYMDTQQAINLATMRRFAADGIEFAYPTQTLFVEHQAAAEKPRETPGEVARATQPTRIRTARASGTSDDGGPAVDDGGA